MDDVAKRLEVLEAVVFELKTKVDLADERSREAISRAIDANIGVGSIRESTHKYTFVDPHQAGGEFSDLPVEGDPLVGKKDLVVKAPTEEEMNKAFDEVFDGIDNPYNIDWASPEEKEQ